MLALVQGGRVLVSARLMPNGVLLPWARCGLKSQLAL